MAKTGKPQTNRKLFDIKTLSTLGQKSETMSRLSPIIFQLSWSLELGKGFRFAGRQVRFSFDEEHFYVDQVFYNCLLNALC